MGEPGPITFGYRLAQDPTRPTHVAAEFAAADGACTLRFAHGGWTADSRTVRDTFGDWRVLLDRFAALAEA